MAVEDFACSDPFASLFFTYFSAVSSQLHSNAAVIAFIGFKMSPVCHSLNQRWLLPILISIT